MLARLAAVALLSLSSSLVGCSTAAERAANPPVAEGGASGATSGASAATSATPPAGEPRRDSATGSVPSGPESGGTASAARIDVDKEFPVVRALYVNRFAAQSTKRMRQLIQMADETEINAFVIDMKDEFGLNYKSSNPEFARNAGTAGTVRDLRSMLDTLRAHKILPIARLVVFKDSVTARNHPDWTIRRQDNSIWRDKQGLAWVNPYHHGLWSYNIGVGEELATMGFGEIQFDYIRFPEPYKSLPPQVFPDTRGQSKPDVLAAFLKTANARFDKLGVRTTADIFGLVTTVRGPLEIGQEWEKVAPVTDVLLPMVYPSHYPRGSFGVARPNAEPYKIIYTAIKRARERDEKLGIGGEHVRPWLQAFSLGQPKYDASHMREQIRAVYDAGYDGWVLWSPGSNYDIFLPAFAKTTESRKKRGSSATN